MKESEVNRWDLVMMSEDEIDPNLIEYCLSINETLSNRSCNSDVVNWEEKAEMDQVTRRSGKYLETREIVNYNEPEATEEKRLDETSGAENEGEKELMAGMGDILREIEEYEQEQLNNGQS